MKCYLIVYIETKKEKNHKKYFQKMKDPYSKFQPILRKKIHERYFCKLYPYLRIS